MSCHISFCSIVSRNTLDHVIGRHFESVFGLSVIELFFIVQYFLYRTANVIVQLLYQQLLFLVFFNPLSNELVGPVDYVLVQLQLFFLPLQCDLLILYFLGVKVKQGIALLQKCQLLQELVFLVTDFVLDLVRLLDTDGEDLASFSKQLLTFKNTVFLLLDGLYCLLLFLRDLLPYFSLQQFFLLNLNAINL